MENKAIYSSIITSKTGIEIPVLKNGKTLESKYNPQREADYIVNNIKGQCNFFVVPGISSGVLIETLLTHFPTSKIIGIESNQNDLTFLYGLKKVSFLKDKKNIIFTTIDKLENVLINNYLPGIYGNLKVVNLNSWSTENEQLIPILKNIIKNAINIISSDYSVQAHFGKIWQHNIISNLYNLSFINSFKFNYSNKKTALVVAAGPSLDNNIKLIKENYNNFYIISTDTAYPVLIKNEIIPNIVISLDGQFVSHNHFLIKSQNKINFFFDLSSDNNSSKYLINKGFKIVFFISGHPLSALSNYFYDNNFISLYSGAGTVTITALDLAVKLGFKNIELYGGDFSYSKGKAYTRGTYFEPLFLSSDCKIDPFENKYNNLMFRTELLKIDNESSTTTVLKNYKNSMELFFKENKLNFYKHDNIYKIINTENLIIKEIKVPAFPFKDFLSYLKKQKLENLSYELLPYISWLRTFEKYKNLEFSQLLKLAHSHIVRYN